MSESRKLYKNQLNQVGDDKEEIFLSHGCFFKSKEKLFNPLEQLIKANKVKQAFSLHLERIDNYLQGIIDLSSGKEVMSGIENEMIISLSTSSFRQYVASVYQSCSKSLRYCLDAGFYDELDLLEMANQLSLIVCSVSLVEKDCNPAPGSNAARITTDVMGVINEFFYPDACDIHAWILEKIPQEMKSTSAGKECKI